jgi:hypothetical protein
VPLNLPQLLFADPMRAVLANCLERTDDGKVCFIVVSGLDRAAVNKD